MFFNFLDSPTSSKHYHAFEHKTGDLIIEDWLTLLAVPSPDTSRPGSWRDTCRSPRCWHGDRRTGPRRPPARRRGATRSEPTGSEGLGSAETPDRPEPSSAPRETPSCRSERDGSFPERKEDEEFPQWSSTFCFCHWELQIRYSKCRDTEINLLLTE